MQLLDVHKEQAGCSKGCDHSVCWNKVGHITHGVHNIHDHVVAVRLWELNDEVDADGVPTGLWNREQNIFSNRRMMLHLSQKVEITCLHILTDVERHLWPPVVSGY